MVFALGKASAMARPLRIQFPGAIYHVSSRMVGSWNDRGDRLYRDGQDYQRFVERLKEGVRESSVRLYLLCLMSNHFHLLLEAPAAKLSRFMQKLTTGYNLYYKRRHQKHGHVPDGRVQTKDSAWERYFRRVSL